ncbi:GPO family capsid scaffolding protein [Burkholderia pseudomallei]|uniref:GPO family capsid scaffolding protein n=1 Tax=Burkholderia pseudomallei TaxID=28450 RepID=UPI0004877BF1|nr:GPO family capsid scaffolding protein [Burkholderia pseudomallei]
MASKTKFFRVAVEGATVDGREIKREWLTQMAKHYDTKLYSARVNVEHIKGWAPLSPTNPFGSYGDVIALKTAEVEDGPLKGKMGLYAQINPTDELVALSKKRQKIFTSIEINPDFADIGEAYLVGLAATDDPASLGTEALQFAAKRTNNLYSAACETAIEFEDEPGSPGLTEWVKNLFARRRASDDERFADVREAVERVATHAHNSGREVATLSAAVTSATSAAADAKKRADDAFAAVEALTEKLSNTDNGAPLRPPSTGSTGELVTDC